MNGRYGLVTTSEERIAIACIAAHNAYRRDFPKGVTPGVTYLAAFLKPFIERECLEAQLSELHRPARVLAPRELDLAKRLTEIIDACNRKIDAVAKK